MSEKEQAAAAAKTEKQFKIGARVVRQKYDRVQSLCGEVRTQGNGKSTITTVVLAIVEPVIADGVLERILALPMPPRSTFADRMQEVLAAGLDALERRGHKP